MKQILDVKYILFNNGSLNHAVVQGIVRRDC